jgi:hypothetical protein
MSGAPPRRRTVVSGLAGAIAAATVLMGAGSLGATAAAATSSPNGGHPAMASKTGMAHANKKMALYLAMRKLWDDHMYWTYATVDAFFHEPKNEMQAKLTRLLDNQTAMGDAIKPYFGEKAGNKLSKLLHTHIKDAVPVLEAAKKGDKAALKKAMDDWYANAKEIADFLSGANPENWPKSTLEKMLHTHITQTKVYSVDLLNGDYEQSITDFDKALAHMRKMGDLLAKGIIAKFPEKFGGADGSANFDKTKALYLAERNIWDDHMHWTVRTVDAFFHEKTGEMKTDLARLQENQTDGGDAIKPYFGEKAGNHLASLLHTHISDAVPVLKAAKKGDKAALKKANDAWYSNAKEIADFLSGANPENWPKSSLEKMLHTHISQTETYSVDLLKKNYKQSITDFDTALEHMEKMGDVLAEGIIAKFPKKFGGGDGVQVLPQGSVNTGGGGTSDGQDVGLIALGAGSLGAAATAGAGAAAFRRHRRRHGAS